MQNIPASGLCPSPFHYESYRSYLQDWMAWAKASKKMTQEKFSRLAGLRTHTLVGMVVRGDRGLTPETAKGFKRALGLGYQEGIYFEALVRLNQARSIQDQILATAELQSATLKGAAHLVQSLHAAELYIKDWYVPAVRELLKLPALPHQTSRLAAASGGKISEAEIKEAISILERLNRIQLNPKTERYDVDSAAFDFNPGQNNLVLRNYHCKILDYTRKAAETQGFEDRELSSLCIATNQSRLTLLKQRINEFRREIHFLLETQEGEPVNQVVLINHQLLQLLPSHSDQENPCLN